MDIGALQATLSCDVSQLRGAEGSLRQFGATADSTFSSSMAKAAEFAAGLLTVAAAVRTVSDAISIGMRVETMGVAMQVVAKNVGLARESLEFFQKEVKSAGITTMEASSAITKGMILGLDLNKMKELATRARDIAVVAGMNTSEAMGTIMHGIESGLVRTFHTMGIAVRDQKTIFDEYALSIGKTKTELNQVEKAQAMLNEVLRASAGYAGASAAADATVGKQIASMARYAEEAKLAFWDLFSPGMASGVGVLTQAFKELKKWAEDNSLELRLLGQNIGDFVGTVGTAALDTAKWLAVNKDLVISVGEMILIAKAAEWTIGLATAVVKLVEELWALQKGLVLVEATQSAWAIGVASSTRAVPLLTGQVAGLTFAMSALDTAMGGVIIKLSTILAAAGVYGAIKSFQGKGDTGQGIGTPGTATMGDDMWEYVNQQEDKGFDLFKNKRNKHMEDLVSGGKTWNAKMADSLDLNAYGTAGLASADAKMTAERTRLASKGGEAKGGGKGDSGKAEDAEATRLASLFDTLNKDIARLSEGKLSAVEADYIKTVDQIYKKTEVRATSEAELEVLAKTRATLQKGKLQDDFNLKMAKDSGDVFLAIQKDYEKDLSDYKGLAGAKELTEANRAKKELDARQKFQDQILTLETTSLSAMASAAPLLSQQLPIEKALLDIEIKRGALKMDEELRVLRINHMISAGQEDELRQLKALEDQAKKYALVRKGWMTEGFSGGLKAGSLERGTEAETRTSQWAIDAMKGAETYLGDTAGSAFVDAIHGKKADLGKMFSDLGDTLIKKLMTMGTTKLFDNIWDGIGKYLGIDKTGKLGTLGNPMNVTWKGATGSLGKAATAATDAETKAGKIGYSTGKGSAAGVDWEDQYSMMKLYDKTYDANMKQQTKELKVLTKQGDVYSDLQNDWIKDNELAFKTDYLGNYQTDFTSMATGITGAWGMAQGLMTAAGVSGDSQRLASLAGYGMQGISIIMQIAKGSILADAYRGAAAAYAAMAGIPVVGPALGAIAAAVTFAAIAAFGALGGATKGIASSAGGDYQVGDTGARYVHQGETILPVWAAQSWRDIVSRENTGARPGENGRSGKQTGGGSTTHVHYHDNRVVNAIDARGVDAVLAKHGQAMVKIIKKQVGTRGVQLKDGRS